MADFTSIFIRRPVLAMVISLLILLLGIVSFFSLSLREWPKVETAVVKVNVGYPGAIPEVMESYVTTPIENSISSIDGIDYISSVSKPGTSEIQIHFNLNYDINTAIADVTNKVAAARWELPKDIKDPIISKSDPDTQPIMHLGFQSSKMAAEELTDYLIRVVQPQLQIINGVAAADIDGGKEYAMRIWLNPYAMAAHNITASEINKAIAGGQLQAATGNIKNTSQEFSINAITELNSAAQFNSLVLKNDNGLLTKISDIGRAELGVKFSDFSVNIDNSPGILLPITPKSDANPLDISKLVKKSLLDLQKYFPADLRGIVLSDETDYIRASLNEIKKTLFIATTLVMLIVFLFLGSWRILLIPAVTIPLSIIGVFSIMLLLGYSINTLTLLAIVLAVGMVVDDAIVVLENIYRHINVGKTPHNAALIGAKEIQFAVISITLTLAAVFLPIGFTTGLTKILFKEFAFTLAATVVISGFVALTLAPMLCAKIMDAHTLHGRFSELTHNFSAKLANRYTKLLHKVLQRRRLIIAFALLTLIGCGIIYYFIPQDLAPQEDVGWIWTSMSAPAAANYEYTKKYVDKVSEIYTHYPAEINHFGSGAGWRGTNTGGAFITLKPWDKRKRSLNQMIQLFQKEYAKIPGLQIFSMNPQQLPGSSSYTPIYIAVQSTGDYAELNKVMQKFIATAKENPHLMNVDSSLKIDQPQLDIVIDRNKAGSLGISMQDITDAINLAFGEPAVAHFTVTGRNYDVIPELDLPYKDYFGAVNNLQLRTSSGQLVPLLNLITVKESVRPRSLSHFQQMRFAALTANIMPGYGIGNALDDIEKIAKKTLLRNMKIDYMGQSRQFVQTSGKMLYTFLFAIIFIFLVLAAQFESFRDPLIVMFTVPLSIFGALLALLLIRGTLNIYSDIGLITLIGLISKHGILMVEFANQLRAKGAEIKEAIITAAQIRLRPILMTTFAMIIGAMPLALASGAGAISRQQIGWVIIGGMSIGTLFTLFVIPVMYFLLAKKESKQS
ncbi:MAG: efflux RND transporter permease subunit [Gammaproteobacteria bacterium]|nr:efflux RND transporter permease subunit [Gammaproteobacteria bacterium]